MATSVKTSTFTADDVGNPEPITISIRCRRVVVKPADGNTSYKFRAPLIGSTAVNRFSGDKIDLSRGGTGKAGVYAPEFFEVGDVPGFVETVAGLGAKTFEQEEYF